MGVCGLTLEQRACGYEIVSAVLLLAVLPLTYMKCFWQSDFQWPGAWLGDSTPLDPGNDCTVATVHLHRLVGIGLE